MIKVASRRSSVRVNITISPPIFDWNGVASRFFAMIHDALSDKINVNLSNYGTVPAINLGEVVARYSIFSGQSNIALYSDRLSMEFPVLLSEDSDLAQLIVEHVFVAFREAFPDHRYVTVHANLADHLEILDENAVTDYLTRYAIPSVDSVFGEGNAVHLPGVRFGVVDAAAAWDARCIIERSDFLPNGLYVCLDLIFGKVGEKDSSYQYLFNLYKTIASRCSIALELDWKNGA
ncbi:MAG: hypothetical protein OXC26_24365 [Albidovulum sp.]|nr:hypothetical protein [Albidovulum sp.]